MERQHSCEPRSNVGCLLLLMSTGQRIQASLRILQHPLKLPLNLQHLLLCRESRVEVEWHTQEEERLEDCEVVVAAVLLEREVVV